MRKRMTALIAYLLAALLVLPIAAYAAPAAPSITGQPEAANCELNSTGTSLAVTAEAPDGATLSYQWYSNSADSNSRGTLIDEATESTYTPPTDTQGVTWYYCVVTSTDAQGDTASTTSDTARIEVATSTPDAARIKAATYYDVWVAGTQVSNLNASDVLGDADTGATVTYDAASKTLMLNNAQISATNSRYVIYAEQDLTISLTGENSVRLDGTATVDGINWVSAIAGGYTVPEPAAAIACKCGSLTVQSADASSGKLTVANEAKTSYTNDTGSFMSAGIAATGTVTIKNAQVEAASYYTFASRDTMDCSYAIFAGQDITIDGASVTSQSSQATHSAALYALTGDINLNGNVRANGDRAVTHLYDGVAYSAGIYASEGSVKITGGTVAGVAGSLSEDGDSYGIFGYGDVSITGGLVFGGGTGSNMDGVEPTFGAGIYSVAGNVNISGKDTQVEANGGYASNSIAGIYANAGNVLITDANVKASAQYLYEIEGYTAVGIYAGNLSNPRAITTTGNIVLKGADVQTVGLTHPVQFSGSLIVAPADGMWYAVDALRQVEWGYSDLPWDNLAASATGIQGSPFETQTSLDNSLVAENQYLHFYNVDAESEIDPEDPNNPNNPTTPENPDESKDSGNSDTTTNEDSDSKIPATGDFSQVLPSALTLCSGLVLGAAAIIRKRQTN